MFNLAGPLGDIPLKFYGGLEQLFLKMIKKHNYLEASHVAHFNLSGGPRDLNVPTLSASFDKFKEEASEKNEVFNSFELSTLKMKNVF